MKKSILALGLIASAGFAVFHLPCPRASASTISVTESAPHDNWTHYNDYTGTDEDGNRERVKTGDKGK